MLRLLMLCSFLVMAVGISRHGHGGEIDGTWDTRYGVMEIETGADGQVRGAYNEDAGQIVGDHPSFNGLIGYDPQAGVLSGYWIEDSSSRRCDAPVEGSQYWGRINFRFNDSRTRFEGMWDFCGSADFGAWSGARSGSRGTDEFGREFDAPASAGVPLDYCLRGDGACGQPAADAFCRAMGFARADSFDVERNGPPTRQIGSGELCEDEQCVRITRVFCAR